MPTRALILCALAAAAALTLTGGLTPALGRQPDELARPLPQRFAPEPAARAAAEPSIASVRDAIALLHANLRALMEAMRSEAVRRAEATLSNAASGLDRSADEPSLLPERPATPAGPAALLPPPSGEDTPDEPETLGCTAERHADGSTLTTVVRCSHHHVVSRGAGSTSVTSFSSTSVSSVSSTNSR
jgi:hypothetical protein